MGRIDNIILLDDKEKKFHIEVGSCVDARRGGLTDAIIEAIDTWLEEGKVKKK